MRGRALILVAAVALAMLALVAQTSANGVKSGKTKLRPDVDTFEALADMGISVETTGQAEFEPRGAKFPISGGDIDPSAGFQGIYGHKGGLMFSRSDGPSVQFKHLEILIDRRVKLFAFAGESPIKLAKLQGGAIAGTDTSFEVQNFKALLSKQGAEVLTETFDFPFRKGIPLGRITSKATITAGQVEE